MILAATAETKVQGSSRKQLNTFMFNSLVIFS